MTERREQGTGSLRERPAGSGRWEFQIRLGIDQVTGDARRVTRVFYAKSKSAARKQADDFRKTLAAEPTEGSDVSLRLLFTEWTRHVEAAGHSPHTLERNARTIETVYAPLLDLPISAITVRQLDGIYDEMLVRGLSPSTVRRHHAVIASAYHQAREWQWIAEDRDPTKRIRLPRQQKKELEVPTLAEIQDILAALNAMNPVYEMAAFLAAATGCRRGELCALRWSDYSGRAINVSASLYRVGGVTGTKGTKSDRERTVPIVGPAQVALDAWRETCAQQAVDAGSELADDAFILSSWPDGSRPLNPDSLSSAFTRAAKATGHTHVHFHSLRHFAATEMLAGGAAPQDAAKALGHADTTMTLNVYAHSTEDRLRAVMESVGRALGS